MIIYCQKINKEQFIKDFLIISIKTVRETMQKDPQKEMYFIPLSQHQVYSEKIRPILQKLSKEEFTFNQLITHLKQFQIYTQTIRTQDPNPNHPDFQYKTLKRYKTQVLPIFREIAKFVLEQQKYFETRKIKILLRGKSDRIELNKEEVIYLMSLMALNLVPLQQYEYDTYQRKLFPFIHDFSYIFSQEDFKTQTIIEYFKFHFNNLEWKKREEKFVIQRKLVNNNLQSLLKQLEHNKMVDYDIRSDNESIEDFTGEGKVDFANKFIGGGALHRGCVQEQIMFGNHPQLFISVIFCEVMNEKESLFLEGFRKYSKNKGYARTTKYDGQEKIDQTTFEKNEYIIAIDAFRFQHKGDLTQVSKEMIDRQILKAYAGFINLPQGVNVATGNWGCGAFSGDVRVKFLIQWLACSMAGKKMIYCPFGQKKKLQYEIKILDQLSKLKVGEVYKILVEGGSRMKSMQENIFDYIDDELNRR